jgi:hypothetical protein
MGQEIESRQGIGWYFLKKNVRSEWSYVLAESPGSAKCHRRRESTPIVASPEVSSTDRAQSLKRSVTTTDLTSQATPDGASPSDASKRHGGLTRFVHELVSILQNFISAENFSDIILCILQL